MSEDHHRALDGRKGEEDDRKDKSRARLVHPAEAVWPSKGSWSTQIRIRMLDTMVRR